MLGTSTSESSANYSALSRYVQSKSREALDELIREHVGFVFAAARRQVGDAHLAEDVTQAVFMVLAKRAQTVKGEAALVGWLFRTVRYAAANALKMERRRRKHEQAAAVERREVVMFETDSQARSVSQLLDQMIAKLGKKDQTAILLRYFQNREMADVGVVMGIGEVAARKRVGRAVEHLRGLLARYGITMESAAFTGALSAGAMPSAPPTVITAASLATASGASASVVSLTQAVNAMIFAGMVKSVSAVVALIVLITSAAIVVHRPQTQSAIVPAPISAVAKTVQQNDSVECVCVDSDGNAVPGAEVYLLQLSSAAGESTYRMSQDTGPLIADARGVVRIAGMQLPPIRSHFERTAYARVPNRMVGFTRVVGSPTKPAGQKLTITLGPSVSLHGKIAAGDGSALSSAMVRTSIITVHADFESSFDQILWSTTLIDNHFLEGIYKVKPNPDTSFIITDVPAAGRIDLVANATGMGESQQTVMSPGKNSSVVFQMKPQATVRGHVTLPDGRAAVNLTVKAEPLGTQLLDYRHPFFGTTDVHGDYLIDQLPPIYLGVYSASADGVAATQAVRLVTGEATTLNIALQRGTLISGKVTDRQNKPVAGATIGLISPSGLDVLFASTTTDNGGRYFFRAPTGEVALTETAPENFIDPKPADRSRKLVVPADSRELAGPDWRVEPAPASLPDVASARIEGRVVDDKGQPVTNLPMTDERVEHWGDTLMPIGGDGGMTDGQGKYAFSAIALIKHTVHPRSVEFDQPKSRTVIPVAGDKITLPDLVVHARPIIGTISGIVTDPKGRPLENVAAEVDDNKLTDADGRFTLSVRSHGFTFELLKDGYQNQNWNDIPVGAQNLQFTLYPKSDLSEDYSIAKIPKPESLLNQAAPAFHADWVFNSAKRFPTTARADLKTTVVVFAWDTGRKVREFESNLEQICTDADAALVIIYTPQATDAGVRALFAGGAPGVAIGIDQYRPDAKPNDIGGQTRSAYCAEKLPMIYLIAPDGTVVGTCSNLTDLKKHLSP